MLIMARKKGNRQPEVERRASPPRTAGKPIRRQLDRIDRQIVEKLNERARLVGSEEVWGLTDRHIVDAMALEEAEIAKVVQFHGGPLGEECVRAVFRELLSGCRALRKPICVAFLGPDYSFSHVAAIHRFGQSAELVPVSTIASVFEEVHSGQSDFGLVPVENSTDGRVVDTLEMFAKLPVRICGEVPLRIHHCLLGTGRRADVTQVYSKPQALSQCRNWLAKHLPVAQVVEVASTSEAAQRAKTTSGAAAIAGHQAAVNYQLDVLAANIEDNPDNLTRFAVIGLQFASRTGDDKTALLFEIPHQPGALADAMAIFKRNRLNMTWIESFPIPGAVGRYWFFVEFVGHHADMRPRRALAALSKKTLRLDVLGSYARMEAVG
jgi:chorismate mutase/prephenate dehydratase